ncbi:ArgS-related anticodon-binding protein NrtL [Streptomyces sp. NBC_00083]|uniref:ArgS-related anticodon-binding protein NrtL n=1 Tax=Streptomyces sp. NBC_00083 TaxID=2975647 RepID=UPI00225465EB|nr:DALR anticodon-binding domain-containing protein [Streptomyces sp. NBC_00083]MCX5385676.1 DALR anticodon-binding domain-containing protein [Streptomyces sp. NBC_00083]
MTPSELSRTVVRVVRSAVDEGALDLAPLRGDLVVKVERPRPGGRGDYASGIALKLAAAAGLPPRAVAEVLRTRMAGQPGIALVEISGPGFLNITLDRAAQDDVVRQVRDAGLRYGYGDALRGQRFEFAGPGEERAAVVVEVVVRLLEAQGALARVVQEGGAELPVVACAAPRPAGPQGPPPAPLAVLVGVDAARWALLRAARHDRPRTDVEELLAQRESNSLFRVRYAHSRSRALTRNAAELGFASEPGAVSEGGPLLALLGDHPAVLEGAARHHAPDRLARHLEAVADELLRFQHAVLPRGDEKPSAAHRSRLALAEAAGTVLAGGLSLLGIDAPEFL